MTSWITTHKQVSMEPLAANQKIMSHLYKARNIFYHCGKYPVSELIVCSGPALSYKLPSCSIVV